MTSPELDVADAIAAALAAHRAPGVIGLTTRASTSAARRGDGWSAAQIEAWRDTELGWLNHALLEVSTVPSAARIARIGLALADTRIRDVVLGVATAETARHPVAEVLWPVVAALPVPWRAPAGTVLALIEWTRGCDPRGVLDFATAGARYDLAEQFTAMLDDGYPAQAWCQGVAALDPAQLRHGVDELALTRRLHTLPTIVLGAALARAGWAVSITNQADTPTGPAYVGYLLHEHTRVGVVAANVEHTHIRVDFPGRPADQAAWEHAVGNAAVSSDTAITALVAVRGLELIAPGTSGRVAASPVVVARADQITATGPTRATRTGTGTEGTRHP